MSSYEMEKELGVAIALEWLSLMLYFASGIHAPITLQHLDPDL